MSSRTDNSMSQPGMQHREAGVLEAGTIRMNSISVFVVILFLLLGSCTDRSTESVAWRTEKIEHWQDSGHYVRLQYPVVLGGSASRLNPVVQRWIGTECGSLVDVGVTYSDAQGCLNALAQHCVAAGHLPQDQCYVDVVVDVRLDAAGLFAIKLQNISYGGGAHELYHAANLNIDLQDAHVFALSDLLNNPDTGTLALRITHAFRAERHIPEDQTLTQAGYLSDRLPVPTVVMAVPEGLLFSYQTYEIAPFSAGQPQVLVPYSDLSDMVRAEGPLPRLHALLATTK